MAEWRGVEFYGRTVLDVGGYDGHDAIDALKHGASRATVIDNKQWRQYGWPEPVQDDRVVYADADLFDWDEKADVVLCINVIYHLRNPLEGIKKLRQLTREVLIIRSSWVPESEAEGGWHWYENGSGHQNNTVWARPTRQGLWVALESHGFKSLREPEEVEQANDERTIVCRPA